MATKASGTLVLIIGKQHASWDLMCSTLPALELPSVLTPAPHSLRRPHGPLGAGLAHAPYWWLVHV